jgi:hypothetical protein
MLIQGYHPGLEDDAFYLAAIKRDLSPSLFPHDADFFRLQFQATIFDKLVAFTIRLTHVPLMWGLLFWQWAITFLILWGIWRLARRCFPESYAQWSAVTMVAAVLTLPIAGTAISLSDQHLHPRAVATAAILAAIVAVIDRRRVLAVVLLVFAFSVHALMAAFGMSFCLFLLVRRPDRESTPPAAAFAALTFPLAWVFEPASDAWRQAAATRPFYYVLRWHWYEWLGVLAPIVLLWAIHRFTQRRNLDVAAWISERLVYFAVFQLIVALAIMLPASLERLRPFEPMRFLHLVYLLFAMLAGGLIGKYILKRRVVLWLLLFVPLAGVMFYSQLRTYPATAHIELPGASSHNEWVDAFHWISGNTPVNSLFAIDPQYMRVPGEDYHGFRALAERSVLADVVKDPGMAARVPRLAPRWQREIQAQSGWRTFQRSDFLALQQQFGVGWVVLPSPGVEGLPCPYRNEKVVVCQVQ